VVKTLLCVDLIVIIPLITSEKVMHMHLLFADQNSTVQAENFMTCNSTFGEQPSFALEHVKDLLV
jgi:hypothetical protein